MSRDVLRFRARSNAANEMHRVAEETASSYLELVARQEHSTAGDAMLIYAAACSITSMVFGPALPAGERDAIIEDYNLAEAKYLVLHILGFSTRSDLSDEEQVQFFEAYGQTFYALMAAIDPYVYRALESLRHGSADLVAIVGDFLRSPYPYSGEREVFGLGENIAAFFAGVFHDTLLEAMKQAKVLRR